MICSYCGREWKQENGRCAYCGAQNKLAKLNKYDPFFYDGYIVYCVRDYSRDLFSWIYYKGITLVGRVDMDSRELAQYPPAEDIMPRVMERLNQCSDTTDQV